MKSPNPPRCQVSSRFDVDGILVKLRMLTLRDFEISGRRLGYLFHPIFKLSPIDGSLKSIRFHPQITEARGFDVCRIFDENCQVKRRSARLAFNFSLTSPRNNPPHVLACTCTKNKDVDERCHSKPVSVVVVPVPRQMLFLAASLSLRFNCRVVRNKVKNILALLFLFIRLFLFFFVPSSFGGQPLLLLFFCAAARTKRRNGRTRWKPPATCPALGSLLGRITSSEMPYLG